MFLSSALDGLIGQTALVNLQLWRLDCWGASWEVQQNVPLHVKICTASAPTAGTLSVTLYESDDNSYGSWHDRFRFDTDPTGEVTITT